MRHPTTSRAVTNVEPVGVAPSRPPAYARKGRKKTTQRGQLSRWAGLLRSPVPSPRVWNRCFRRVRPASDFGNMVSGGQICTCTFFRRPGIRSDLASRTALGGVEGVLVFSRRDPVPDSLSASLMRFSFFHDIYRCFLILSLTSVFSSFCMSDVVCDCACSSVACLPRLPGRNKESICLSSLKRAAVVVASFLVAGPGAAAGDGRGLPATTRR